MRTPKVLLCAMLLVLSVSGTSRAESFVLGVSTAGGWLDVTQAPFGNLCWAASSSNMLAYSGWNGGFASADAIFGEFSGHWTNEFGNPYYGINWFFDGSNEGPASMAEVTSPGGNFYTNDLYWANNGYDEPTSATWNPPRDPGETFDNQVWNYVTGNVTGNRAFTMLLGDNSQGWHWLTGWGYEDAGGAHSVWVTDSWTGGPAAGFWMNLSWDGSHWVSDYDDNGWYVRAMASIYPNSDGVPPNPGGGGGNGGVVPEPTSMLLLGAGLSGLFFYRRRTRP